MTTSEHTPNNKNTLPIFVDDGSSDNTLKAWLAETENDSIQVFALSRNFDKERNVQ